MYIYDVHVYFLEFEFYEIKCDLPIILLHNYFLLALFSLR